MEVDPDEDVAAMLEVGWHVSASVVGECRLAVNVSIDLLSQLLLGLIFGGAEEIAWNSEGVAIDFFGDAYVVGFFRRGSEA